MMMRFEMETWEEIESGYLVVASEGGIDYAYIIGSDNTSYKMLLADSRGMMDTPLDDYTVSEGLSFLILVCIWLIALIKFLGWCFRWMK